MKRDIDLVEMGFLAINFNEIIRKKSRFPHGLNDKADATKASALFVFLILISANLFENFPKIGFGQYLQLLSA